MPDAMHPSKQVIAPMVADIRRRAAAVGRNPADTLIFAMMTVITGATPEAARAKLEDYQSYVSEEGALVLMSGWTGIDISKYRPDEPIRCSRQDAQTSALEAFTLPIRAASGQCGKSPNTPPSAAADRSWSARPWKSPKN